MPCLNPRLHLTVREIADHGADVYNKYTGIGFRPLTAVTCTGIVLCPMAQLVVRRPGG